MKKLLVLILALALLCTSAAAADVFDLSLSAAKEVGIAGGAVKGVTGELKNGIIVV